MNTLSLQNCRVCKSELVNNLWDLAQAPYGDLYCKNYQDAINLEKIDLTLQMCEICKFIQLGQNIEIDTIYKNYLYNSSITLNLSNYYNRITHTIKNLFELNKTDLIIDIGSNDGTYLKYFSGDGFKVLGVEPANSQADRANYSGIPTINDYLNAESVELILSTFGEAKLVSANYVAANVPDPIDFFKNLKKLMKNDGILSIITGYHPDQFSINMFEYINHDHLSYFSISTISYIANLLGLEVISVEKIEHKGGSVLILFKKTKNTFKVDSSVSQLIQREKWMGIDQKEFYLSLKSRINQTRQIIQQQLPKKDIIGIGASISSTHFLHQFGIGERFHVLLDDDSNKYDKYSPGFGIRVQALDVDKLEKGQFVVILAWQHSETIIKKLKNHLKLIDLYLPLPFPKFIYSN